MSSAMSEKIDDPAAAGDQGFQTERVLSPAARRALAEAEARRRAESRTALPAEVNGRPGPEPTRFGDWEKNGIVSDF